MSTYHKSSMIFTVTFAMLALVLSPLSLAHNIEETSARVTLRDGQVEVVIYTDVHKWQSRLQSNQAWLMHDIDKIMPEGLTREQRSEFTKSVIREKTHIAVNNSAIKIDQIIISEDLPSHHNDTIIFTGKHSNAMVTQLDIGFAKSLGTVHTSVVKPKYKVIPAGVTASISLSDGGE